MRLFWWQQLPLLILLQFLEPCRLSHKLHAEALLAFKSTVGSSRQFVNRIGRSPCVSQLNGDNRRNKFKDLGIVSLSTKKRVVATVDGGTDVPTLTPVQVVEVKKPSKQKLAAIVGGVGAALLVVIIGILVYCCLIRLKRFIRRTSDTASSVPSPPVEQGAGYTSPGCGDLSAFNTQFPRQLTNLELQHATVNFSQSNIIGEGGFGLVYQGLLEDGSIVAIKRRLRYPIQNFFQEVKHIARVHHKHLVKLVGYCAQDTEQFLVYDYLPNGNVGNHLYDIEGIPNGKIDMRQRLLIALDAAKGLEHLHSLVPPVLHMRFKTTNVLVDENFMAKVSDFGLSKLLAKANHVGSSSTVDCYLDPELKSSKEFSERSDVYSFGVFLLELVSGKAALGRSQLDMQENLVLQAKGYDFDNFVDKTVRDHSIHAVKQMMELALLCVDIGLRRPAMKNIMEELQGIQEREIGHLHSDFIEEIGNVTLGSELFK